MKHNLSNNVSLRHKVLASLAGTALAATALIGASTPAAANPNPALPNPHYTHATLHINTRDASIIGSPATGAQVDVNGLGDSLAGIEFTARQVTHIDGEPVDLLTLRGWELAAGLDTADALAGRRVTFGTSAVTTTDGAGAATKHLPIGLYFVVETATPAGVIPGRPFLVTLPLTNPAGDGWLHDVWVYPKADAVSIDKTVEVAGSYVLGDSVTWTIRADIPRGPDPITGYLIANPIDERLSVTGVVVSLTGGPQVLPPGSYQVVNADGQVRVQFNEAGLALLDNAGVTQQVQVSITTEVNQTGDGIIQGGAWLFPSAESISHFTPGVDPTDPSNPFPPVVSPRPDTRWGGIDLQKTSLATSNGLVASYQVFRSEADARAGVNPVVVHSAPAHANGGSVWTTDANGRVSIDGLRISQFGVPGTVGFGGDAAHTHDGFWLVEVLAPVGYELLAEPLFFHVNNIIDGAVDLQVANVPANAGFALPLTGGAGTRNFAAVALLVAASGVGAVVARQRKVTSQADA